ncbi:MAG TPA: hypothetical protein VFV38_00290 [Ktedonobacteraceae bacterium]|nr:hypothetical protein [Ktedonobacteraceae bacterium]
MSLSPSPIPSPERIPQKTQTQALRHLQLWQVFLAVGSLALLLVLVWPLLNQRQNGMLAGRPLSYPQTHLHTVVMSSQPGVVYLGTHYGIFTSTDGGYTWPQSQGDLHTNMITALAISATHANLLAALAVPTSGLGRQAGVYVSADAGKNWRFTVPEHLPTGAYPYTLVCGTGEQGRFYAFFSYAGWFETQDLGKHWYAITSGALANISTPSLLSDSSNPEHLVMGGDQGLFETYNDGQNWHQITAVQGAIVSLVATHPVAGAPRTVFCATDQGLYRWQESSLPGQFSTLPVSALPTRLAVSADGTALYALVGLDLWFSADQGTHWVRRWHFARSDIIALVINPARSTELLAGFFAPGLVQVSTDAGRTWRTLTA